MEEKLTEKFTTVRDNELILDDQHVSLKRAMDVAFRRCKVVLSEDIRWREKVEKSRRKMLSAGEAGLVIYGFNTGVGNASKNILSPGAEHHLQSLLVAQHGCGLGNDLSEVESRLAAFARLVSLCKGYSGVRMSLLQSLKDFINSGVVAAIPEEGSVGASGDLTPLSYLAAALMGEREAYYQGVKLASSEALSRVGLEPLYMASKEGIAMMNGTSVMTSVGAWVCHRSRRCLDFAIRCSALCTEVLCGDPLAFHPKIHELKPHPGQQWIAEKMYRLLKASKLARWEGEQRQVGAGKTNRTVQDRYSIRCVPHVLGATADALTWVESVLESELNSVNDNPMIDPDDGAIYMGGNFYGGHVALAMDMLKITLASTIDLLDRQFALLVDESNNRGLPENLLKPRDPSDPEFGLFHGLKGLQITMTSLSALAAQRTHSDTITSRPTEAGNQDKVSMGTNAAIHAREIVELLEKSIAVYMVALAQAAYIRGEERVSPAGQKLLRFIRNSVSVIERDRPIYKELVHLIQQIQAEEGIEEPVERDIR